MSFFDAPAEQAAPATNSPFGDTPMGQASAPDSPFGDTPMAKAPASPFGDTPMNQPAQPASAAFTEASPVTQQLIASDRQQNWEKMGAAALASQKQAVKHYMIQQGGGLALPGPTYEQRLTAETGFGNPAAPSLPETREPNVQDAIAFLKATTPPADIAVHEDRWKQEYLSTAKGAAVNQQQAAADAARQPEVGWWQGMAGAIPRGAGALVTAPVALGSKLIQAGAEKLFGVPTDTSGAGVDPNAGQDPYYLARQATATTMAQIEEAGRKAYPQSTIGAQHPLTAGLPETILELAPQMLALGPGLMKGGVQGVLANTIMGSQFGAGAYNTIHQAALAQGMDEGKANDLALAGGVIGGTVNAFLMRFGILGQLQKQPNLQRILVATLAQGGVGTAQAATDEALKYIATGEAPGLERILHAAAMNAILGGAGAAVLPGGHGKAGEQPQEAPKTLAPSPETLKGLMIGEAKVPEGPQAALAGPEPLPFPTTARRQVGEVTTSVKLAFADPMDKALYIAGYPRKGVRGEAATKVLEAGGIDAASIPARAAELRQRVNDLVAHNTGDRLLVLAKEATAVSPTEVQVPLATPAEAGKFVAEKMAAPERPMPPAGETPEQQKARIGYTPAEPTAPRLFRRPSLEERTAAEKAVPDMVPGAVIVRPSRIVQAAADAVKQTLGYNVVHFEGGGAAGFAHPDYPNTVFVNASKPLRAWVSILGHEWMHGIQTAVPGAARRFYDALPESLRSKYETEYRGLIERAGKTPEWAAKYLTPDQLAREVGAMALGDTANRARVRREILGQDPTLWAQIVDAGSKVWDTLTGKAELVDRAVNLIREQKATVKAAGHEEFFAKAVPQGEPLTADFLKKGDYTVLTAGNPQAKKMTPEENARRNVLLEKELTARGLKFTRVPGYYGGAAENSYLVPGMSREVGLELGKKFGQESILRSQEGLVYGNGKIVPKSGETSIGPEALKGENFSIANVGGEKAAFTVPLDFSKEGASLMPMFEEKRNETAKGVPYWTDLNPSEVHALAKASSERAVRGLHNLKTKETVWWDAMEGLHPEMADALRWSTYGTERLYLNFDRGRLAESGTTSAERIPDLPAFSRLREFIDTQPPATVTESLSERWTGMTPEARKAALAQAGWPDESQWGLLNDLPAGVRGAVEEIMRAEKRAARLAENKGISLLPEDYKPKSKKEREAADYLRLHATKEEWNRMTPGDLGRAARMLKSIPSAEDIAAIAKAGKAAKGWYEGSAAAIRDMFQEDSPRFVSILAALSPRRPVHTNFVDALRVWDAWDAAGRPSDEAGIKKAIEPLGDSVMAPHLPNVIRSFMAPDQVVAELGGEKVRSFAQNLAGNLESVTLDTWMAKFAGLDQKAIDNIGGYAGYAARIREAAKVAGMEPAQVQETIWSFFRNLSNRINKGVTGKMALEELTHKDLANASGFDTLLGDQRVQQQLSKLGFSPADIASAQSAATAARGDRKTPGGYVAKDSGGVLGKYADRAEGVAKHPPSAGTKAQGTMFYPGEKVLKEDFAPVMREAVRAISGLIDWGRKAIVPAGRSPEAAETAGLMRERGAEMARRNDIIGKAFDKAEKAIDRLTVDQQRAVTDAAETGQKQAIPALQAVADGIRRLYDDRLQQIQSLGNLKQFVTDYMGHMWKNPGQAIPILQELMARRPLAGKKGFLKPRAEDIPTQADGVAKGLIPITDNPVTMMKMKLAQMDKFITTKRVFAELTAQGLLRDIKATDKVPDGYAKIDDSIATVYAKPTRRGAIQIAGYKVAPEPVATIINNHLSPGLRGHKYLGPVFRGWMYAGNLMNSAQLFGGFHALMTSGEAMMSKMALAIKYGLEGKGGPAIKKLLEIPIAPVENPIRGDKLMQEWYTPGSTGDPALARAAEWLVKGGGRVRMHQDYSIGAVEKMQQAMNRANYIGGALRAFPAAIEMASKPIMEMLVPRQKLGVAFDMIQYEIERLGPNATHAQIVKAAGKVWDSVDNRMGQVVYDNLFWNRAVKDLAMASQRSVGWNWGTVREIGGGITDWAGFVKELPRNLARKGYKQTMAQDFTHRMAYVTALPVVAGLMGGTLHYLFTGQTPAELKDWYYPKTGRQDKDGNDIRLSLPTYMKDVWAYASGPVKTATNKTHPLLNTILEMLANKDYYGTKIRNEDDPGYKQFMDLSIFAGKQFEPFASREGRKLMTEGQTPSRSLLPMIGITTARTDITRTPAQQLAGELAREKMPVGGRTQVVADRAALVRDLAYALRDKEPDAEFRVREAVKEGKLMPSDIVKLKQKVRLKPLEYSIEHSDMPSAMKIWAVMDQAERKLAGPWLFKKLRAAKALSREDRAAYMAELQKGWKEVNP